MGKKLYSTATQKDEMNREYSLDYFIIDELFRLSASMGSVTYGVAVQKRSDEGIECAFAPSMFTSASKAEEFARLLVSNGVTPTTLLDIAEDYVVDDTQLDIDCDKAVLTFGDGAGLDGMSAKEKLVI